MKNIQLDHDSHVSSKLTHPLCLLAHNMELAENVGSIFRIADAFGVEKIFLTGKSLTPPNLKIRKVSRSTEKYVSFSYDRSALKVIADLKAKDYRIICLEITSSSIDLERLVVSRNEKICLVVGSEKTGVCQEILDSADTSVHIPMLGKNSSMNVANACAIAVYQITRNV